MNRAILFLVACALGGLGGLLGSMFGAPFGKSGMWAGGILGGLVASMLVARIALARRWIVQSQSRPTALGTAMGFLAACAVAANTLSSPVGLIMSTLLVGAGALFGSSRSATGTDIHNQAA